MRVITRRRYALFQRQYTFTFNTISQLDDPYSISLFLSHPCVFRFRCIITQYLRTKRFTQWFGNNFFRFFCCFLCFHSQYLFTPEKCHTIDAMRRFYLRLCVTLTAFFLFSSEDDKHSAIAVSQLLYCLFLYNAPVLTFSVKPIFLWMLLSEAEEIFFMVLRTFRKILHNRLKKCSKKNVYGASLGAQIFQAHPVIHWIRLNDIVAGIFHSGAGEWACGCVFLLIELGFRIWIIVIIAVFNSICNNQPKMSGWHE